MARRTPGRTADGRRARPKIFTEKVMISLTPKQKKAVEDIADRDSRSVSDVIRTWVVEGVARG